MMYIDDKGHESSWDLESIASMVPQMEEALRLYGRDLLLGEHKMSEDGFREALEKKAEELGLYLAVERSLAEGDLYDEMYRGLQRQRTKDKPDEEWVRIEEQMDARVKAIANESYVVNAAKELWDRLRKDFILTPNGNGERFVAENMEDVRFCPKRNSWYVWDGRRWLEDSTKQRVSIRKRAWDTVRRMKARAEATNNKELLEHWQKSDKPSDLNTMLDVAVLVPDLQIHPEKLDDQKPLLNCQNGSVALNLRHSEALPHRRSDYQTRMVPWHYDPEEDCPTWKSFLAQVTMGDRELQDFLQRIVGYALTGEVAEKCLFFLLGGSNTGKTTFLEAINELLGSDYAAVADFASFALGRKSPAIRSDLARMQKKRYVSASEAGKEEKFDDVVLKRMTGSDTIVARFLFKEFDEFRPEAKVFLAANHGPLLDPHDKAAWNRFVVIPFDAEVPPERQDRQLKNKFRTEMPGILRWAVKGARDYYEHNLMARKPLELPESVREAIEKYRTYCQGKVAKIDPVGLVQRFIDERIELAADAEEKPENLYAAFQSWWKENVTAESDGETPVTENLFGRQIKAQLGITSKPVTRAGENYRIYKGIKLMSSRPENE